MRLAFFMRRKIRFKKQAPDGPATNAIFNRIPERRGKYPLLQSAAR